MSRENGDTGHEHAESKKAFRGKVPVNELGTDKHGGKGSYIKGAEDQRHQAELRLERIGAAG